jgi:hypothetical protein
MVVPSADAPDFYRQSPWIDNLADRMAWVRDTSAALKQRGAIEIRTSMDRTSKPTLLLMEGWRTRPKHPPPPRFMPE